MGGGEAGGSWKEQEGARRPVGRARQAPPLPCLPHSLTGRQPRDRAAQAASRADEEEAGEEAEEAARWAGEASERSASRSASRWAAGLAGGGHPPRRSTAPGSTPRVAGEEVKGERGRDASFRDSWWGIKGEGRVEGEGVNGLGEGRAGVCVVRVRTIGGPRSARLCAPGHARTHAAPLPRPGSVFMRFSAHARVRAHRARLPQRTPARGRSRLRSRSLLIARPVAPARPLAPYRIRMPAHLPSREKGQRAGAMTGTQNRPLASKAGRRTEKRKAAALFSRSSSSSGARLTRARHAGRTKQDMHP